MPDQHAASMAMAEPDNGQVDAENSQGEAATGAEWRASSAPWLVDKLNPSKHGLGRAGWSEARTGAISVRSSSYLTSRRKQPSEPAVFEPLAVNLDADCSVEIGKDPKADKHGNVKGEQGGSTSRDAEADSVGGLWASTGGDAKDTSFASHMSRISDPAEAAPLNEDAVVAAEWLRERSLWGSNIVVGEVQVKGCPLPAAETIWGCDESMVDGVDVQWYRHHDGDRRKISNGTTAYHIITADDLGCELEAVLRPRLRVGGHGPITRCMCHHVPMDPSVEARFRRYVNVGAVVINVTYAGKACKMVIKTGEVMVSTSISTYFHAYQDEIVNVSLEPLDPFAIWVKIDSDVQPYVFSLEGWAARDLAVLCLRHLAKSSPSMRRAVKR